MNAVKRTSESSATSRSPSAGDEAVWVRNIRDGSEPAFEALFHKYYDDLLNFARLQLRSLEAAEEIVQNVFLSIWKRRATWRPRGTLTAYLYGAVRNKIVDHLRRRGSMRLLKQEAVTKNLDVRDCPESACQYRELQRVIQAAIEDLPERRRLIFRLSREHQLTYAEIAALLDLSINTVENQMVRAIRQLRERVQPYLQGTF